MKRATAAAFAVVLAAAPAAGAQSPTRQLARAVEAGWQIDVDSALLARTAAEARVAVPRRHLVVIVTPGSGFACGEGRCSGQWAKTAGPDDYIVVAEARLAREPWLLRHEYLHHVLQTGDHPVTFRLLGIPEDDGT